MSDQAGHLDTKIWRFTMNWAKTVLVTAFSLLSASQSFALEDSLQDLRSRLANEGSVLVNPFRVEDSPGEISQQEFSNAILSLAPLLGDFDPTKLPLKFAFADSAKEPALQTVVDELFERIFMTSTGRDLCRLANGHVSALESYFGLSHRSASHLASHCTDPSGRGEPPRRAGKRRFFVVVSSEALPIDSWSTLSNNTLLFFRPGELTYESLLKKIAHEIAVVFDTKENIDGIWLSRYMEGKISFTGNRCQLYSSAGHPLVRGALIAARAYGFERTIFSELGLAFQSPFGSGGLNATPTCEAALKSILPALFSLRSLYRNDMLFFQTVPPPSTCGNEFARPTIADAIRFLRSNEFISVNGTKVNVCDYLLNPSLGHGPYFLGKSGPRPRISGGWDTSLPQLLDEKTNVDDFAKALRNYLERPNSANKKNLDRLEPLPFEAGRRSNSLDLSSPAQKGRGYGVGR